VSEPALGRIVEPARATISWREQLVDGEEVLLAVEYPDQSILLTSRRVLEIASSGQPASLHGRRILARSLPWRVIRLFDVESSSKSDHTTLRLWRDGETVSWTVVVPHGVTYGHSIQTITALILDAR
jgi:hypothetical protein